MSVFYVLVALQVSNSTKTESFSVIGNVEKGFGNEEIALVQHKKIQHYSMNNIDHAVLVVNLNNN